MHTYKQRQVATQTDEINPVGRKEPTPTKSTQEGVTIGHAHEATHVDFHLPTSWPIPSNWIRTFRVGANLLASVDNRRLGVFFQADRLKPIEVKKPREDSIKHLKLLM